MLIETRDPVVVVKPLLEPVTLGEALTHVRASGEGEGNWVTRAIIAARRHAEQFTGRALITQTLEWPLDGRPALRTLNLPRPPLQEVLAVEYLDASGETQTLAPAAYMVDTRSTPGRLRLRPDWDWPEVLEGAIGGVVFRYKAGYGDSPEDVPQEFAQAILMIVGHLYENRESTVQGVTMMDVPFGVDRLLWPYRVF